MTWRQNIQTFPWGSHLVLPKILVVLLLSLLLYLPPVALYHILLFYAMFYDLFLFYLVSGASMDCTQDYNNYHYICKLIYIFNYS